MTISSTRGIPLTVGKIVEMSYRYAGLLGATQTLSDTSPEANVGATMLDTIIDALQAEGVYAHSVDFQNVAMVVGQRDYVFADSILDLVGEGAYIDSTETDIEKANAETVVKQIDRQMWQRLSSKASTGRPVLYFVERSGTGVTARVWPLPDEAGTIRFQVQQLPADTFDQASTPDLKVYWQQYMIWELAHQLALSNSIEINKVSYLAKTAERKKNRARAYANQHVPNIARVAHSGPWGSRGLRR